MRRRVRESGGPGAPPLPLAHYRGSSNREAFAWLRERGAWWDATHDEDHGGWLPWLLDGWAQTGDPHWCGSAGAPCADPDCLCNVDDANPIPAPPQATERKVPR